MNKKLSGVVKTLTEKGFGFLSIAPESEEKKDLFFHSKELYGVLFDELRIGDVVEFDSEENNKGSFAVNVSLFGSSNYELDVALDTLIVDQNGIPLHEYSYEGKQIIIDISSMVNEKLLTTLRDHPEIMQELPSRRFEEVVAELLRRLGYEVDITPATKDGGFDIYAAQKNAFGRFLFLVECKRYAPSNKVGVEIVRSLHGVVEDKRATAGVVVTTSFFTKGAKEFQRRNEYKLQLQDYLGLKEWLRQVISK